jgi:guanylate kinase
VIEERLAIAREQLDEREEFDYVVENDDRERAARAIGEIVDRVATMAP